MLTIVAGAEDVFYFSDEDKEIYREDLTYLAGEMMDYAKDLPSRGPDLHLVEKTVDEEPPEETEPQDCPEPEGECIESEADKRVYKGDIQLDAREQYQRLIKGVGTFEDALHAAKNGLLVQRQGWNGKGMWIEWQDGLCDPTKDIQTEPFIMMKTADEKYVPWLCSVSDMSAVDWMILGIAKDQVVALEEQADLTEADELSVFLDLLTNPERCKDLSPGSFFNEEIGRASEIVIDYHYATRNRSTTFPTDRDEAFAEILDSGIIGTLEGRDLFNKVYGRAIEKHLK